MAEAGFDPRAAETFWMRMIDLDRDRPQTLALLSTHPADDARLTALRVEIERFATPQATQNVARSAL
jgi:predicted Zn-dependent protease